MRALKTIAVGTLLMLLGVTFAQTQITWWDFLSGGDGVRMKAMIDEFNATHPDIQIKPTTLEWGTPFYSKIRTSIAVGQQPDIMTYHISRFPLGVQLGDLRPISDEELASVGLSKNDYQPGLVDKATIGGNLYGVPLDIHSSILYYNAELLEEAGLLGEDGLPKNLDGIENFIQALETIQERTGKTPLVFGNTNYGGGIWRLFYTLFKQQGGELIEGNEVSLGEEGKTALETIKNWLDEGYVRKNLSNEAAIGLFTSGEAAFLIKGVWEVPTMTDLAADGELFEWGAIPHPAYFDGGRDASQQSPTWADAHTLAIPSSSKPMSEEKLAAVLEIMAWMNKNSIMWASGGHVPAYVPVTESEEYQAMEPQRVYSVLARNPAFDPQSPVAGVASPVYDGSANFLEPAIGGRLPIDRAIEMFERELESQLR
jgi:multiple sugar transport system substrate-binding protein